MENRTSNPDDARPTFGQERRELEDFPGGYIGAYQIEKALSVKKLHTPDLKVRQVNSVEFIQARSKSTRPQFLTPYTEKQLSEFELYLIGQDVGYALTPNKDLVNLFNNSGVHGAGAEAVIDAISKGAKTLDCFSGYLCDYYKRLGFTEVKRVKWNDKSAPDNWDLIRYRRPAIVHMEYAGNRDAIKYSGKLNV